MCLYPKRIINKKYIPNEKNQGIVPKPPVIGINEFGDEIFDERVLYVNAPCGQCIECRQQKARNWQVRLHEELKHNNYAYFVTLTFSPIELQKICLKTKLKECNEVAAYAVRHSLERFRKDYKKSLRHWYITELGHEGTERIHLHGIIFNDFPLEFTKSKEDHFYEWKYWKYGLVYVGDYCNARTINYIVKYMHKIDKDHKGFIGQVLASPGIGRTYTDRPGVKELHRYRPGRTIDYYRLNNGAKIKLPSYWKNKCLSDQERELQWREFMDHNTVSILGNNHELNTAGIASIGRITAKAQEVSTKLGYGDDSKEWKKKDYNITRRMMRQEARIKAQQDLAAKLRESNYEMYKKIMQNEENL